MRKLEHTRFGWVILFTSMGTLLCCALPILLVSLGLGAVVASMATSLPWLTALSAHKIWVFAGTALLLMAGGFVICRPGRACPTDPELARLCQRADFWNRRIFWVSVAVWGIGTFFAYLFLPLQIALGL